MGGASAARPLCLVGMSNVGKSRWATRLAREAGHEVIDCDLEIARRLFPGQPDALAGERLAAWLGQPGDPGHEAASVAFLRVERAVMLRVLERLRQREAAAAYRPLVIDTGGSVVHAGDDVLAGLRALTRVIYLETAPASAEAMYTRYLAHPKALIWADAWQPRPGEAAREARARCYPLLLASRARRYAALAHVSLPAALHAPPDAPLELLISPGA